MSMSTGKLNVFVSKANLMLTHMKFDCLRYHDTMANDDNASDNDKRVGSAFIDGIIEMSITV